ncbi:MAG: hypothetical protein JJT76_06130 [Clostridiaceae bacterium]|nr:hypothetical protein [Clostridiaceae bacterium]
MNDNSSLAPRFVIFHYLIEWFIENFGLVFYFALIILPTLILSIYTLRRSIKAREWDRFLMICIFMLIVMGGLIGLGFDIHNGYRMFP